MAATEVADMEATVVEVAAREAMEMVVVMEVVTIIGIARGETIKMALEVVTEVTVVIEGSIISTRISLSTTGLTSAEDPRNPVSTTTATTTMTSSPTVAAPPTPDPTKTKTAPSVSIKTP